MGPPGRYLVLEAGGVVFPTGQKGFMNLVLEARGSRYFFPDGGVCLRSGLPGGLNCEDLGWGVRFPTVPMLVPSGEAGARVARPILPGVSRRTPESALDPAPERKAAGPSDMTVILVGVN